MEGPPRFQPKRLNFGSPGKPQPGGPRIYVQGRCSGTHRSDGKMKKPSDQRIEGLLPITYGAVRRLGLGHPLRRDPERVTHTNMRIRNDRSKPDTSTSLRIGHFYFAPTFLIHILIHNALARFHRREPSQPSRVPAHRPVSTRTHVFVWATEDLQSARRFPIRQVSRRQRRQPVHRGFLQPARAKSFLRRNHHNRGRK